MYHSALREQEKSVSQVEGGFLPIRVCEIELSKPLPVLSATGGEAGQRYGHARCLVRLHTRPLGLMDLPFDGETLDPASYAPYIWQELREQINSHLREDGQPEVNELEAGGLVSLSTPRCIEERNAFLQTAPFISVILATRDRPESLARCLPALLAQQYPDYEVLLIDNAPSTSATADFIQQEYGNQPKIRYIREDRPGLSAARNRGIWEARGEILAFTDDDVIVDACWLAGLAGGFSVAGNVACVTGVLLPLELETPAQLWFEESGGFNKGFVKRVFDRRSGGKHAPLYPFTAGGLGTGASMAFTAAFLKQEKGFDLALGAGSRTGGGEDLAAFFRSITRGYRLVYEPASLAYHVHRRDYASLQKQMYAYGAGLTAYLTKIIIDNPLLFFKILVRIPLGLFFILSARSGKNQKKSASFPEELNIVERKGMVQGPWLYLQGRFRGGRKYVVPVRQVCQSM